MLTITRIVISIFRDLYKTQDNIIIILIYSLIINMTWRREVTAVVESFCEVNSNLKSTCGLCEATCSKRETFRAITQRWHWSPAA